MNKLHELINASSITADDDDDNIFICSENNMKVIHPEITRFKIHFKENSIPFKGLNDPEKISAYYGEHGKRQDGFRDLYHHDHSLRKLKPSKS